MRKILVIIICLSFSVVIFSQSGDKQNPNVELPDFVITGKDVVSLKKAKKQDPGFISTISEQFIKPVFSPEALNIKEFTNPVKNEVELSDSGKAYNSRLQVLTGLYTSPTGNFSFAQPFESGIFDAVIKGENHRAHVDNSDWYGLDGSANLTFYAPNSSALQGTKFKFHGDYGTSVYKFYGSNNPTLKRTQYYGNLSVGVNNLVSRSFNYALSISDDYSYLSKENYSEHFVNVKGYMSANFSYMQFAGKVDYIKQILKNNLVTSGSNYNFIKVNPYLQLNINNYFKLSGGFSYSKLSGSNYLTPYAAAAIKFNDFVSLFAEVNPGADFYGEGGFLRKNRYFNPHNFINAFVKIPVKFNVSVKYQYFKYYEINLGVKYFKSDNFPYFENSTTTGKFNVYLTQAKSYSGFVNLLFHLGPYGIFYGSTEYNIVKDLNGKKFPYQPEFEANMYYGYNFKFGLYIQPELTFRSKSYADLNNTVEVNSYINLGTKFVYNFIPNLSITVKLSNLLDKKNEKWYGYREAPLDLVAGFTYKW